MYAEEKKQIQIHKARMENSTVAIQCFARVYFARQRFKHRIFQVAMLNHMKEVSSVKIESIVRMFVAKRRVAYMLHEKYLAMINATALRIQCWFRVQTSIRLVEFKKAKLFNERMREEAIEEERVRLVAAEEARKRDEEKMEKERKKAEQLKAWENEKIERNLQFMSRDVVRRANRRIDQTPTKPSLPSIAEVMYCIKRFPEDIALQADGLICLSKSASASAPVCHFLLELGIASVVQTAMESFPEDVEIKGAGEELTRLLCAADDIKRAFPVAFEEDIKKLRKSEGNNMVASESTFWGDLEAQLEGMGSIEESFMANNSADSILENQTSMQTSDEGFLPQPYSMSPENSTMLQSIFSEISPTPAFDASSTLEKSPKKPPEMPPRLNFETLEEMKKSVAWKLREEEEKKGRLDVPASGAFSHTPYTLPVGGSRTVKRKKKRRTKKKEIMFEESDEELVDKQLIGGGQDEQGGDGGEDILFFEDGGQVLLNDEEEEKRERKEGEEEEEGVEADVEGEEVVEENMQVVEAKEELGPENANEIGPSNEINLFENHEQVAARSTASRKDGRKEEDSISLGFWTDDRDEKSRISGPNFAYNKEDGDEEPTIQQEIISKRKKKAKKKSKGEKRIVGNSKAKKESKYLSNDYDDIEPKYPKGGVEEEYKKEEDPTKNASRSERLKFGLDVVPRMNEEEWSQKRKKAPTRVAGPNVEDLLKHKTVKKIFENAAPSHSIVKNSFMRGLGEAGALESPGRVSPVGGRGRRHSVRDMVAVFKILDESNTGIISADKFRSALLALSSLGVEEKEVEKMMDDFGVDQKQDYIDYLEFCSSGNVLRIRKYAKNPAKVPFQPWVAQLMRPPPLRSGHIQITWENHVKWYQKRREHAAIWLIKRAVEAAKWDLAKRENQKVLRHKGNQALAICYLLDLVKPKKKHFKKQILDAKDLQRMVRKARKHKLRQQHAHQGLKMMVRKDFVEKIMRNSQQRNYNKIYYLGYKNQVAFEFLLAVGKHSIKHYLEQQANVIWLHNFAEKAKVQYLKCVENYNWCSQRAVRAQKTWANKDYAQNSLVRIGNKYIRVWEEMRLALVNLHKRGRKAVAFSAKIDESYAYLSNRGEVALKYEVRLKEASAFLSKWGFESTHHVQCQNEARDWLRERVESVLMIKKRQDAAQQWLQKTGKHSKRHLNNCIKAREALYKRIEQAKIRTQKSTQCMLDLAMFVDDARMQVHKQILSNQFPGLIKSEEKNCKMEDKERQEERKNMGVDERFKTEMKDAFVYFDTDESGEIDRVEFRHLLVSGHLIEVPPEEIDDCYTQIDKDGSSGIDFEEFFAWFLYEFSHNEKHHGRKETFKLDKIIPAKQRALRKLLPKFVDGEMLDDFGEKVPAPGVIVKTKDTDDRWWLDEVERAKDPYGAYKERLKKREEEREKNMTHEEKVERRKLREAEKKAAVEAMKGEMRARLQKDENSDEDVASAQKGE